MRFTNLTKKTPLALGLVASIAALPVVADIADEISELALPHIFQAGTPARADDVNQNFDAIKNAVNQNFNAVVTSLEPMREILQRELPRFSVGELEIDRLKIERFQYRPKKRCSIVDAHFSRVWRRHGASTDWGVLTRRSH